MKIPTWVYFAAIIMILFGACNSVTSINLYNMPEQLELQKSIMDGFQSGIFDKLEDANSSDSDSSDVEVDSLYDSNENTEDSGEIKDMKEFFQELNELQNENMEMPMQFFDKMLTVSEETKKMMKILGLIGVFLYLLYLAAGIFLFVPRNFSLPLAYGAVALSFFYAITVIIAFSGDGSSIMTTGVKMFQIFMLVVNIGVLVLISTGDKSIYTQEGSI